MQVFFFALTLKANRVENGSKIRGLSIATVENRYFWIEGYDLSMVGIGNP